MNRIYTFLFGLLVTVKGLLVSNKFFAQCSPDNTKPTWMTCTANQTVGTNTGCTYVHPDNSWDPVGTDNCPGALTYSYIVSAPGFAAPLTTPSTLNGYTFAKGT